MATCLGTDERTLARWLTRAALSWERLVQETEWGDPDERAPGSPGGLARRGGGAHCALARPEG